jgi:hypothetical protein
MRLLVLATAIALSAAWPGMKAKKVKDEDYIGPACTVGAHNWHPGKLKFCCMCVCIYT